MPARKIFLAIPAYLGTITVPTFLSVLLAKDEAQAQGWEIEVPECIYGDADLARCRNVLIGRFLQSACTDLFSVDADISWGPGAFTRLMSHEVDFVAGVYRMRTDEMECYPVHWPKERRLGGTREMPLLEADLVPGGFWHLTRACVEKMAARAERPACSDKLFSSVRYPWLYDFAWVTTPDGDQRRSEDYTFCRKWQELGGTVWVDPTLCLDHTGMKTFQGDLLGSLQREAYAARPPAARVQNYDPGAPEKLLSAAEAIISASEASSVDEQPRSP